MPRGSTPGCARGAGSGGATGRGPTTDPDQAGHGPVRVCPDPEHCFVEQYELGKDPPLGSFRQAGYPGAAKVATVPMPPRVTTLGPQTESVMTEHFVVAADSIYAFNWQICQGPLSRKSLFHGQCDRELIWSSPPAAAARAGRAIPRVQAGRRPGRPARRQG
jgi:hypothetical protein